VNQLTNTNGNTEEGRSRRLGLTNFEKLIRDAIALLIKRGEIKIPERNGDLRRQPGTQRQVTTTPTSLARLDRDIRNRKARFLV
jgi:hypothetical protein